MNSLDGLRAERFALWRAGLSPVDWMQLTRWQRLDLLLRHQQEVKDEARKIRGAEKKKKLGAVLQLLVKRLLRI